MNKESLAKTWDYFRIVNGVGLRAIAALPTDKLNAHPIPGMRTPTELVVHMYGMVRNTPAAIAKGEIGDESENERAAVARIKSKDPLLRYCREAWAAGARSASALTDTQIAGLVKTPWGQDFPGFVMMDILYNEYWHHRGQLYCYLRALGVEPPMLYGYEDNEPAFRKE